MFFEKHIFKLFPLGATVALYNFHSLWILHEVEEFTKINKF